MDWVYSVQKALSFIEVNLLEDLTSETISQQIYASSSNFQRVFHIVSGVTMGEYIRNRRLSLAGKELVETRNKVIDIVFKYGYETAESFTKAFRRFHGIPPSAAKKSIEKLRHYAPLLIQISVEGGFMMNRKLIPNVPLITMSADGYTYLTSFTGALYGAVRAIDGAYEYSQILSHSALGNRFCWTDGQWLFGNEDIENCNTYPFEAQNITLACIGWRTRVVTINRDIQGVPVNVDDKQMRRDFVDSIDKGIPVLAQGITDDGCKHDYGIFFGYEDVGHIIFGWDYYQNDDSTRSRVKWENEIRSYILLIEQVGATPEPEAVLSMFTRVVTLARTEEIRGKKLGLAAWQSFLHQLEKDDFSDLPLTGDTPPGRNANNVEHRFIIYCDALAQISQRGQILPYYRRLAKEHPQWADDLNAAIDAWDECGRYGGFPWSQGLSFSEDGYRKFKESDTRKLLAAAGRDAMEKEYEAIQHIEKILKSSRAE